MNSAFLFIGLTLLAVSPPGAALVLDRSLHTSSYENRFTQADYDSWVGAHCVRNTDFGKTTGTNPTVAWGIRNNVLLLSKTIKPDFGYVTLSEEIESSGGYQLVFDVYRPVAGAVCSTKAMGGTATVSATFSALSNGVQTIPYSLQLGAVPSSVASGTSFSGTHNAVSANVSTVDMVFANFNANGARAGVYTGRAIFTFGVPQSGSYCSMLTTTFANGNSCRPEGTFLVSTLEAPRLTIDTTVTISPSVDILLADQALTLTATIDAPSRRLLINPTASRLCLFSNTGAPPLVTITSANNWRMKDNNDPLRTNLPAYYLSIGGVNVGKSAPLVNYALPATGTPCSLSPGISTEFAYEIPFTIGVEDASSVIAGSYSDVISIAVSPQ